MDNSGGIVPGAAISLKGAGVQQAVQTQADGSFTFANLPAGEYEISATYPGFTVAEVKVAVEPGATREVALQLNVTTAKQEVTVQADAGPEVSLEPDNNSTALVLKDKDLDALPDDPEDLQDALEALAGPGAGPNGGSIYIDGFSGGELPPKEMIREIRINQNPFSAEYDKLGFGRIEILTKPGADKLRGSFFFNDSDALFNSRNPFSSNKPDYSSRMYGGNIGGPLGKRASYFLNFNQRRVNDNAVVYAPNFIDPVTLATVPVQQSIVTPFVRTSISPRFDFQLSQNHTLTARFEENLTRRDNQGIGGYSLPAPYASLGYNSKSGEQNAMITETAVLSPRMINETRFQYERNRSDSFGGVGLPEINVAGAFTAGGNQTGRAYTLGHHYELQNNTSFSKGAHTIRWGIRLRRNDTANNSPAGYGGTFSFLGGLGPELDASNQPVPGSDGQPVMTRLLAVEQYRRTLLFQSLGYAPDQIRALGGGASRFTINAGNPYASIAQFDAAPWFQDDWRVRPNLTLSLGARYEIQTNVSDHKDFAPRIGFAWAPGTASHGRQKTVVRGGFGLFYDRVNSQLILNTRRLNGVNQLSYVVNNPDFYPNVPSLSTLTPAQNSVQTIANDYRAPYSMQAAIGVERQLPRNTTAAITYTFTRANHLGQTVPINAPLPGTYPLGQPDLGVRPLGDAGNIFQYESGGVMKQHMLMTNFNTRFSPRVSLFGNYTLNFAHDLPGQPSNPYNFAQDWGRSQLDRRHRFQLAGSVTGPLALQFSPFVIAQSGGPYDVLVGTDIYGTTWTNARAAFAPASTADTVCRTGIGCFESPVVGGAVVPRNYLNSAATISLNLRLSRSFTFGPPRGSRAQGGDMMGMGGGPGGFGGGPHGGGGPRGGGGRGMQMGGGGFGGGEGSAERRFGLTFSMMVTNVLNHFNPGGFQGNIYSPQFGMPTTANTGFGGGPGGGGGGNPANNRRVEFQTRFTF
jgi:hypothetical protein